MKNFLTPSLGILMAGSLSVAIAQQPAPKVATTPAKTAAAVANKAAITQELRTTFAYARPVRVGALMTKREKMEYKRAMQTATTAAARQQIRELTYAKLNQRAMERGMFVVIPSAKTSPARGEVAQARTAPRVAAVERPVRQPPRF